MDVETMEELDNLYLSKEEQKRFKCKTIMNVAKRLRAKYGDVVKVFRKLHLEKENGEIKRMLYFDVIGIDGDDELGYSMNISTEDPEAKFDYTAFISGIELLAQNSEESYVSLSEMKGVWQFLVDNCDRNVNLDLLICEKDGIRRPLMNIKYGNIIMHPEIPLFLMDDICDIIKDDNFEKIEKENSEEMTQ